MTSVVSEFMDVLHALGCLQNTFEFLSVRVVLDVDMDIDISAYQNWTAVCAYDVHNGRKLFEEFRCYNFRTWPVYSQNDDMLVIDGCIATQILECSGTHF